MRKYMDFPEASHYSVELGEKKKTVHQTDSIQLFPHCEVHLCSELCLFSSLVFSHRAERWSLCILVTLPLITALLIHSLPVLPVCTLIHSGSGAAFFLFFLLSNNRWAQTMSGISRAQSSKRRDLCTTSKHELTRLILEKKGNNNKNNNKISLVLQKASKNQL